MQSNRLNAHRERQKIISRLSAEEFKQLELKQAFWIVDEKFRELDKAFLKSCLG